MLLRRREKNAKFGISNSQNKYWVAKGPSLNIRENKAVANSSPYTKRPS